MTANQAYVPTKADHFTFLPWGNAAWEKFSTFKTSSSLNCQRLARRS